MPFRSGGASAHHARPQVDRAAHDDRSPFARTGRLNPLCAPFAKNRPVSETIQTIDATTGMRRSAAVRPQLNATVPATTIASFAAPGRSAVTRRYWSHV